MLQKWMKIRRFTERPSTPPPCPRPATSFQENMLPFVWQICKNLQRFIGNDPPPFRIFSQREKSPLFGDSPKIHPFWRARSSLTSKMFPSQIVA